MSDASSKNQAPLTKALKSPWGAGVAIVGAALSFFLSQIFSSMLVSSYPQLRGWSETQTADWLNNSSVAQFWYVLLTETITIGVLWLFWRRYKTGVREALGFGKPHWHQIVYAFAGVAAYFFIYFAALILIDNIVPINTDQEQNVGFQFQDMTGVWAVVLAFVGLVILPPIVEEIVFRGFLYAGFRRHFGVIVATFLTSILFAAPHLLTGKEGLLWVGAIDTFFLSSVLCYLREKTGTLYASILVHAIKNSIAFVALLHIAHVI